MVGLEAGVPVPLAGAKGTIAPASRVALTASWGRSRRLSACRHGVYLPTGPGSAVLFRVRLSR
jgi:hypothetical protein